MLGSLFGFSFDQSEDGDNNNSKKRKYPEKAWHYKLKNNTRIELVNYIVEITQGNIQVIRKKMSDLIVQSQGVDDFAQSLAEYSCTLKNNIEINVVKGRVEEILDRGLKSDTLPMNNNTLLRNQNRIRSNAGAYTGELGNSHLVVRSNEFNDDLFEKMVERNKVLTQSCINHDMDIPEIMEQYKYCNKLAKLWIMQDLTRRKELKCDNDEYIEFQESDQVQKLPFDLMFEIVSFIPVRTKSLWWAQYLKYRTISKAFKTRIEQEIFTKFTNEGIDLSHCRTDNMNSLRGLSSLLASHAQFEQDGKQFTGDFIKLDITEKVEPPKIPTFKFNGQVFPPSDPSIQEKDSIIIDTKIFDEDYIKQVYSETIDHELVSTSPFQRNAGTDMTSGNIDVEHRLISMQNDKFKEVYCAEFENPYIKSLTLTLTTDFHFIVSGLVNLEELTVVIQSEDFMFYFAKLFHNISHLRLKKISVVYYGMIPKAFSRLLLDRFETLDYGGTFYLYAGMDSAFIDELRQILPFANIICEGRVINRSNDFRDLKLIPCRIQNFNNTKFILENGWFSAMASRTRSFGAGADKGVLSMFNNEDWFTVNEKKELLNYFIERYPFEWFEPVKTSIHQSLIQYYIYLLNVNQKPFTCKVKKSSFSMPLPNESLTNTPSLLDFIIWGLDISTCPEKILGFCTNFGKIGLKLVIAKLEKDPDYINIEKMRNLIRFAYGSSDYLHLLVQLIPHIKNHECLFDTYVKDGTTHSTLLTIINHNPVLVDHIIENYVTSSNLETELEYIKESTKSFLQTAIQSQLGNSTILKIVKKNPKLLCLPTKTGRLPLHYCFISPNRYELIKPFLEMAPETLEHQDNRGFKPYYFIRDQDLDNRLYQTPSCSFELFIDIILPDFAKDTLRKYKSNIEFNQ